MDGQDGAVEELVTYIRGLGVTLTARHGELTARGPKGAIDEDLAAEIRRMKGRIMRWLEEIVEWEGTCSVCGTAVRGAGTQGSFAEPVGEVTCLWCVGKSDMDAQDRQDGEEEC